MEVKPSELFFQLFGHARSPSVEFKELTKRDAQVSLAQELDKLRRTGNLTEGAGETVDKEFDGFRRLFAKFLTTDANEAVKWEEIEKLPKDAVNLTSRCTVVKENWVWPRKSSQN